MFNQINAYPEDCQIFILSAKNSYSRKYLKDIEPIYFYEGHHLKDRLAESVRVLEYLCNKELIKKEYIVFS